MDWRLAMKNKLAIVVLALALVGGSSFILTRLNQTAAATDTSIVTPAEATENLVVAEAKVVPLSNAALGLPISGVIAEVVVQEGAAVQAGDVLVRLDNNVPQARLARAEAQLDNAKAQLRRLLEGAQPEEIEVARAQLAQAQLAQTRSSVSAEDLAAVQTQIRQAQQLLARLEAGPKEAQVQQARRS